MSFAHTKQHPKPFTKLNWDKFLEYAYNYKFKRFADVIEYEKYKNIGTVEECEKAMKFVKHYQEENKYL